MIDSLLDLMIEKTRGLEKLQHLPTYGVTDAELQSSFSDP